MKHVVLSPLGKCLSIVPLALVMFGCASSVNHDAYAVNNEKTEPIIEHYRKQNVLHEVNGDDTVENVFAEIDKIISE